MEPVSVDLEVLTNYHVMGFNELFVVVFEGSSFKEFSIPKAGVFRWGFINLKSIIIQEVGNDEASVCILGFRLCEDSIKSEGNLLINPFKEVFLRGFRD